MNGSLTVNEPLLNGSEHAMTARVYRWRFNRRGCVASHRNFSCDRGRPCVFMAECEEDEVEVVLTHETLHHALHRIGEEGANDALDRVMPDYHSTLLWLGLAEWNPSWGL